MVKCSLQGFAMSTTSKLGYPEYVCFPDDGKRHEIVDGDHYMNPAPSTYHQTVPKRLMVDLYLQIESNGRGQIFYAPTDLQLTDFDIVQPDLLVVLNERVRHITPTKIKCVPHLVVEIISPSNETYDRVLKKQLYERTGVPEYWVVDPSEHVVEQFLLQSGQYKLVGREQAAVTFMGVDEGITVDLSKVW